MDEKKVSKDRSIVNVYNVEGKKRVSESTFRVRPKGVFYVFIFILLFISILRISTNTAVLSFDGFLDFLEGFNRFSDFVKNIQISEFSGVDFPKFLAWAVEPLNKVVFLVNVFFTLGTLIWKVLYVFINVLLWALFGVNIM